MEEIVMVIPGAKAQIPLIEKLHEMNYKVLCINPYEDSPAFAYADYCEMGDILDREFCLQMAKKYKVKAVMSDECDIAMPTIGYVSEQLGLPSIGSRLAELYTNKFRMREFSEELHMPCPKYRACENVAEALAFFESLEKKKMILKPLDSNSSRGVFTITTPQMLREEFEQSIQFSKVGKAVLCEEYIEGPEFTVDGMVINQKHYSLAISRKKHYDYNSNIACELFFSQEDYEVDYEKLRKQNDAYVEVSKLPFGFTHAEYKFNGKDFVLVEIGARGGGNFISSHIVPNLTGIDNYKMLIQDTLDLQDKRESVTEHSRYQKRCAVLRFFDIEGEGGIVEKLEGEDFLKKCPQVLLYEFRFQVGDQIKKAENDSARIGFYIAMAETREELENLMKTIHSKVQITLKPLSD